MGNRRNSAIFKMPVADVSEQVHIGLLVGTLISLGLMITAIPVASARKTYKVKYPDTGSGRLSKHLTEQEWKKFMGAQRGHLQYLESFPIAITGYAGSLMYCPMVAAILGAGFLIGRLVYMAGYISGNPKNRLFGGIPSGLCQTVLLGASVYGAVKS